VRIAAEVARTAGWSWTRLDLPERWSDVLPAMLPLAVAWSDSRLDVLPLAQVLWSHARKAATMPSLIGGGGYEHSRGQAWSQEFWRAARSTDVNFDNLVAMRWLATPVPPGILARDPTEQIRGDLHERARALVEPHRGELNTFQLDLLYAWRNAAHFGAFANAAGCFVETELPAYFKRVFQTSISINPRHRSRHRLGRKLIARLNPEIAAIETTTGGPAEPMRLANVHRFAPYYGTLGRKAAGKVSGKAFGRPLFVATAPADQRVTDGRRSVLEALDLQPGDLRSGGLYNRSGVERLLAAGRRGDSRDGTMLGRIVTLELSLRAADPGTAPPSLSDARERITALLPERGGGA
jgi:hypothetical protein